ncbi:MULTISPECIES: thiamine pyrophosphate-binding protein [Mameliella]|uniref:thiamine pyrophosphate-binding protein n=1 Tax=Mameliella TaxID=1434019 RepID=UPI000B532321|nr:MULTISPECIES: thiamine pyrophosphate-binding protein [Mameliella]MCR9271823.1 thiamine pyrophosphate-binding protein [Paracoccaceae bacterium]OWV61180.1 decarboxylase [Mameliella alba]
MIHTYDILARTIAQENPGTCFALLGDANMALATRLAEEGCGFIYVRHEHCAVAAAMAHARKTGGVGLATVTCGPGVTQLMTALPAAVRAHLPLVVLAGEAPLKAGWYNQAIDQAPFVTACGAAYVAAHWPARMPVVIRDAFAQARRERRPVVVGLPFDLQELPWDGPDDLPAPSASVIPAAGPIPPNPDDLARIAPAVANAERVIVMAGMGAVESGAGEAIHALARHLDAPTATTLPARGLLHGDPCCLGVAGGFSPAIAREVMGEADLIIALGCSLARHNADAGKLWPRARVLQVDVDPVSQSQGRLAADLHLRADARLGAEALMAAVPPRQPRRRGGDLARRIASEPADSARFDIAPGQHDPRDVVAALDSALPQGWQMVNSSGHCSYFFAQMNRPHDQFLTIREYGAIGNGTSFAMGVAAACKEVPVVLFDGDGSLLMHVQELETYVRHRLPILTVVLNDGAYGSEIHKLRADGLSDAGAVFGRTDLAAIARGFGAAGTRVTDLADLPGLVKAFAADPRPTVLDFPVSDQVVSPVIRRSHGIK